MSAFRKSRGSKKYPKEATSSKHPMILRNKIRHPLTTMGQFHGGDEVLKCPPIKRLTRRGRRRRSEHRHITIPIPDDVLRNILNRLPLKSLCRFKCVSKSWRSLIIDNFDQSPRRPILGKLYRPCDASKPRKNLTVYSIDGYGLATHKYTTIPLSHGIITKPAFCNGLICFGQLRGHAFGVYNPTKPEEKVLYIPILGGPCIFAYEFGFDPLSKKFKVLVFKGYPHCNIHTLGTKLWRPVRSTVSCRPILGGICICGTLYWFSKTSMIVTFNLSTESFGEFQGPQRYREPDFDESESKLKRLFELERSLCLVDFYTCPTVAYLWIFNTTSKIWSMMTSVALPTEYICKTITPYYLRTGEIIITKSLSRNGNLTLHCYSFLTNNCDTIEVVGIPGDSKLILTTYDVESLVSLKDL